MNDELERTWNEVMKSFVIVILHQMSLPLPVAALSNASVVLDRLKHWVHGFESRSRH
jgi:hypothetical protein